MDAENPLASPPTARTLEVKRSSTMEKDMIAFGKEGPDPQEVFPGSRISVESVKSPLKIWPPLTMT